jgi:protein-S-isoprenylcysteine O-methyltransferase Ste14
MNVSHSQKHHNLPGEHAITDIGQLILFVIFILVMIFDIFIFTFSNKMIGTLSGTITVPLFLLLFIAGGCFIFISYQIIFGKTDKEVGIVTNGVFNIVRHPMYFGSILVFFSFVILGNSILAFLVMKKLLRLLTAVPSREAWIYEKPELIGQIKKGLQEAKEGKTETIENLDKLLDESRTLK